MPSAEFIKNPAWDRLLDAAIADGLRDVRDQSVREAKVAIAPFSSGAARAINGETPTKDLNRWGVKVSMGRGLGAILEFSKEGVRRTTGKRSMPPGLSRGIQQRHEFFNKSIQRVVARGLDLRRYL